MFRAAISRHKGNYITTRLHRARCYAQALPRVAHHSPRRLFVRPLLWSVGFLFLGLGVGQLIRFAIIPPPFPVPGSDADNSHLRALDKQVNRLALVKELRTHSAWVEVEAYDDHVKPGNSLTADTLQGIGGLGHQRVFWNAKEQRSISIMAFGGGLCGWPGVAHGGVISTIMQENMERVANRGLQGPGKYEMDEIRLNYLKPTNATMMMVIRAEHDELTSRSTGKSCFKATMELLDEYLSTREVCVEASGTCRLTKREYAAVPEEST